MSELPTRLEVEDLQQNLRAVQDRLARKHEPAALRAELDPLHPADVADVLRALPQEERVLLRAALSYAEGTVGALMDFDQITVREDVTLEAATRYLRALDELPPHTDQLFVVDREQRLKGTLPLARLIVSDLEREVGQVMVPESMKFHPE